MTFFGEEEQDKRADVTRYHAGRSTAVFATTSGRMSRVTARDGAQRSLRRRAGAPFEPRLKTFLLHTKKQPDLRTAFFSGADDEARTRYLHLGKVALYRMSYIRMLCGFVNVYIIHTDRTVVKHYFLFFTVGITRRASKMTSVSERRQKNSQARPNKSRAYFIFTFTVPFR